MKPKKSAFGQTLYSPIDVLGDEMLKPVLKSALQKICHELTLGREESQLLLNEVWSEKRPRALLDFEERLQRTVAELVPAGVMRAALDRRAAIITEQVTPYVVGDSLLDIGCGDGMVAWQLYDRVRKVVITDVHRYLDPRINLPLINLREGAPLPVNDKFDTCLLLTVLHHAEDPEALLRETHRVCGQRAIVIESVYGVSPRHGINSQVSGLDNERQRKYATFIDWLYNRVFHDGVPVPYNFNTPEEWHRVFATAGWSILLEKDLGIDQPLVPEYHFLFVLEA